MVTNSEELLDINEVSSVEFKPKKEVLDQFRKKATPDEYSLIRDLYKTHSISEEKRDLPGLLSTLTDDCEYLLLQSGHSWKGKAGAAKFYQELLTAFPDIDFQLQNIVIGPQGVFQEASVTGTHRGSWLGTPASNKRYQWMTLILFPWDSEKRKFRGERVFSTLAEEMSKD
ncbi:MAG TPA: ester cyclase [Candidatus Hodarchaeales archaeon]|nr:ester cyclase [Candidatus Hodarchaeales archaeon]